MDKAETAFAELLACCVRCCWDGMSMESRGVVLSRLRQGVQAATVRLEEAVEALSEAAIAAAARLGHPQATPRASIALLWRLQSGLSLSAAQLFQVEHAAIIRAKYYQRPLIFFRPGVETRWSAL